MSSFLLIGSLLAFYVTSLVPNRPTMPMTTWRVTDAEPVTTVHA